MKKGEMKNALVVAVLAVVAACSLASAAAPKTERVKLFVGEISDSQCAMNVHSLTRSHEEMLKRHTTGTDAASCARYCVRKLGGEYVLAAKNKVYHLADSGKAEPFSGEKVEIKGTLEPNSDTINIVQIAKAR